MSCVLLTLLLLRQVQHGPWRDSNPQRGMERQRAVSGPLSGGPSVCLSGLSVCLSVCLFVSVCLSVCLGLAGLCLPVVALCLSVCLFVSVFVSVCLCQRARQTASHCTRTTPQHIDYHQVWIKGDLNQSPLDTAEDRQQRRDNIHSHVAIEEKPGLWNMKNRAFSKQHKSQQD